LESQRGIVRNHRLRRVVAIAAPQGQSHEVLMFRRRDIFQAIQAPINPLKIAGLDMIRKVTVLVAGVAGLLGGEETALGHGYRVERMSSF
jgi:hypothetical protein